MSGLMIRPITLHQARSFVQEHHRRHDKPQGGLWAIALALMDFAKYLKTQSRVDLEVIGQNTMREAGSPRAAVEVAIDRVWRFIDSSR